MADLLPSKANDPANPLQPGDPFKRGNFNRFALGMCLLIALFLLAAIAFFYFSRNHSPAPAAGGRPTSLLRTERPPAA